MKENLYKLFRTIQVELFFLQGARLKLARIWRNLTENPIENDFKALPLIKGSENMVYIDIGANRGETIHATRHFLKNSTITAFEPNPKIYQTLLNRFKDDKGITILNFGIGEEVEDRILYTPIYKRYSFDGLSSFYESEAKDWLKGRIFNYNPNRLVLQEEKCSIRPLDSFNLAPNFIKIDVQGFEYKVLLGARKTIMEHLPSLLIETPTEQVDSYLINLGYESFKFNSDRTFEKGHGRLNTFYIHNTKLDIIER